MRTRALPLLRLQTTREGDAVRGTWRGTRGGAERAGGLDGPVGPLTAIPTALAGLRR